jgi:hypothetical protein
MRQQKLRSHDNVTLEQERQDKQRMEAVAEQWKQRCQNAADKMKEAMNERDVARDELDQLQQRYNNLAAELDLRSRTRLGKKSKSAI